MSGSSLLLNEKKEIADYCEDVYSSDLEKKQITDRVGAMVKRKLGHLGLKMTRQKVGTNYAYHIDVIGAKKPKNTGKKADSDDNDEIKSIRGVSVHAISTILKEICDAILSLNFKHHNIERNIDKACRNLESFIPDIREHLDSELSLDTLRTRLKMLYKNETREAVKAELRSVQIEHHAYYPFHTAYVWSRKKSTRSDKKNLDSKLQRQIKVNGDFAVSVAEKLIDDAIAAKATASYSDLAVGLAIATGRRRTEIMKTGQFKIGKTTPDGHVTFSGQLKTKDRALFDDVRPYDIPCLVDRDKVIEGFKLLRKLQKEHDVDYIDARGNEVNNAPVLKGSVDDTYHNEAVSQYYKSTLNKRAKLIFICPELEFRHCRSMYSEISYPLFKNDGEARSIYRTRVYGHAPASKPGGGAQAHYETFEIDNSVDRVEVTKVGEEKPQGQNTGFLQYLERYDVDIQEYRRAPAALKIHNWLKEQVQKGLQPDDVTPGYIRKHCIADGKSIFLGTIKNYLKRINFDDSVIEQFAGQVEDISPEPEQEAPAIEIPEGKPHLGAVQLDNGQWSATVSIGGVELGHAVEDDKMSAMRSAWAEYEAAIADR